MNKAKKICLAVLITIIIAGIILVYPETSPLYATVNVVALSISSEVNTGSFIKNYSCYVNVEQYITKKIMFASTSDEVKTSNRNDFTTKLQEYLATYNITLILKHFIKIYINETNTLIFSKEYNFTSGQDRQINIYFDNSTYPLAPKTVLRIELYHYIYVAIGNLFSFEKEWSRIIYTEVSEQLKTPYVTLTGTLTLKQAPRMIEVMYVALRINAFSWMKTWGLTEQYKDIYLSLNGSPVTDVKQLGDFDLGDTVIVSGYLTIDDSRNFWLDVKEIKPISIVITS